MFVYIPFARCDNEKMEGTPEHPVEITFAGNENVFAQTRSYYPIGQDGNGPLYGTIYIRQIEAKQIDTNGKVTEGTISWGHYKVASGTGDQLETTGDIEPLKWNSSQTSYFFKLYPYLSMRMETLQEWNSPIKILITKLEMVK